MTRGNVFRPDVQGLRAVAVFSVMIFHIWPSALTGGYVGVDVFFVISGYLITAHLLREVNDTGTIDFRRFYLRRAWRLLPASFLVIACVVALTPVLLPPRLWLDTAQEGFASLLYFQNWLLAFKSVDYLGAENSPTPLQHFWSLAVEEQFYAVWPLFIVALAGLSRWRRWSLPVTLTLGIAGAGLLSLAMSIRGAAVDDVAAYFTTQTRIWELAIGGLIATLPPLPVKFRPWSSVSGLAAIGVAAVAYSGATPFPGNAALLPTIGAALVLISADAVHAPATSRLLGNPVFSAFGDISYSLYLWHWPLVVFLMPQQGQMSLASGATILAATILLAYVTKVYVEDTFRAPNTKRPGVSFGRLLAGMATPLLLVVLVGAYAGGGVTSAGPDALTLRGSPAPTTGSLPNRVNVSRDRSPVYDNGCHLGFKQAVPKYDCHFGSEKKGKTVFLIGDSHAVNWLPALDIVAKQNGWHGESFTKSSCALMIVPVNRQGKPYRECFEWGRAVLERIIEQRPYMVVLGQENRWVASTGSDERQRSEIIVDLWRHIAPFTQHLVIMADTARWPTDPNDCVGTDCATSIKDLLTPDPLVEAAQRFKAAHLLDFNTHICPHGTCQPVTGNVLIWRDRHHLTATYSKTLAPLLNARLLEIVSGAPPPLPAN